MDLGFLNFDTGKIIDVTKDIIIRILKAPFLMFNSLPGYVKAAMYFFVFLGCLLVIYLVWKKRDEWLRVNYE